MIDDPQIQAYADAIAAIESEGSGGYSAIGPTTSSGDRAFGRYQVMGSNIPAWTQAALGRAMTPQQFLASPEAQDAVFSHRFGGYVSQYGNPQDAASVWFTGRPQAQGGNSSDGYITGNTYVRRFNAALNSPTQPKQIDFSSYGVGANGEAPGGKSTAGQPIDFSAYGVTGDGNSGTNKSLLSPGNSPDQRSSRALGFSDNSPGNGDNPPGFPDQRGSVPFSAAAPLTPVNTPAEVATPMNPTAQARPGIEIGPDQWTGTGYGADGGSVFGG